jgi:ATP-binding cassette, subfamily B, bacterial
VQDKPDAIELPPLSESIVLDRVVFSYGTGRAVLKDLSLRIPAGSSVAFVGPSGCGKSTTVSLLLRFWDPEEGRVLFDGHDLRDVTLGSLRGQIGYVFQDTFIFDNTVRANIAIGRPDATDAEIAAAAKAARLESFIDSLPNGYDTVLGERGVRMSGGQRQRLAIARAILRDPAVLILDEATSALDAKTEAEILETLSEIAKNRTTVSITHRLSWAARADKIFVLQKGRLVEQGTHEELVRENGLYKRLYEEQTGFVTGGRDTSVVDIHRLREVPLFASLDEQTLEQLARRLRREVHDSGVDIVRQNDLGDKLYLIGQGKVEVVISDRTGDRRVAVLRDGDYFGEMALLSDAPRTASVRTLVPTQLYSLLKGDFEKLLEEHTELRGAVTATVEARRAALTAATTRGDGLAARTPFSQEAPSQLANR